MREFRLKKFIKIKGVKGNFVICWHCGALIENSLANYSGEEVFCVNCLKHEPKRDKKI